MAAAATCSDRGGLLVGYKSLQEQLLVELYFTNSAALQSMVSGAAFDLLAGSAGSSCAGTRHPLMPL